MKKFLLGLIVLGAVAPEVCFHYLQTRTAPDISVWLVDDSGGPGVPAVDGYVSGDSGSNRFFTHVATCKVAANHPGKFFVLAHYHVEHLGISTEYDLALPVDEKKPDARQWAKLDTHPAAFASLDGSTNSY